MAESVTVTVTEPAAACPPALRGASNLAGKEFRLKTFEQWSLLHSMIFINHSRNIRAVNFIARKSQIEILFL